MDFSKILRRMCIINFYQTSHRYIFREMLEIFAYLIGKFWRYLSVVKNEIDISDDYLLGLDFVQVLSIMKDQKECMGNRDIHEENPLNSLVMGYCISLRSRSNYDLFWGLLLSFVLADSLFTSSMTILSMGLIIHSING